MNKRKNTLPFYSKLSFFIFALLSSFFYLLNSQPVYASGGPFTIDGIIYGRGVILSPNNNPYYAEFDTDGDVVSVIGEVTDTYEDSLVMSAIDYTLYRNNFISFRTTYGPKFQEETQIVSKEDYDTLVYDDVSVSSASGESPQLLSVNKGELYPSSKTVVVLQQSAIIDPRLLSKRKGVILFESPLDLTQVNPELDNNSKSVILDNTGKLIYQSEHNIGYRNAYITRSDDISDFSSDNEFLRFNPATDKLVRGIDGAKIESIFAGPGSTSFDGRFQLQEYLSPCPGFFYSLDLDLYAGVPYRNYNPQSPAPYAKHYFKGSSSATCSGYGERSLGASLSALSAQISLIGINATLATPLRRSRIPVDVLMFTGQGKLKNPLSDYAQREQNTDTSDLTDITIGLVTDYDSDIFGYTRTFSPEQTNKEDDTTPADLDLDGDQQKDWVSSPGSVTSDGYAVGFVHPENEFLVTLNPNEPLYVGVYFGSVGTYGFSPLNIPLDLDGNPVRPSIVRLADQNPDFEHRGLLKRISKDDLRNTDLYVYRLSTGQLISQREGLSDNQFQNSINGGIVDDNEGFYYRMLFPGPFSGASFSGRRSFRSLQDWQQSLGISEALQGNSADILRIGEVVQVIAINRETGYIGSLRETVKTPVTGRIDIPLSKMELMPPNLKIRVERQYNVEYGQTKGETRDYLIGSEGAGLTSDTFLAIYTEWFAQDGTALPEDLPGFTGRLAKTAGSNNLINSSNDFIDIKPGKNIQLIRLEGDTLGTEYFYLHLNPINQGGRADLQVPDFAPGNANGVLRYRPEHYVPIQVPVYDEVETRRVRNSVQYAHEEDPEENPLKGSDIEPIYRWVYRPEMHFAVYDLNVTEINSVDNREGTVTNVLELDNPILGADNEQGLDVIFDLIDNPNSDPLALFGPGQDLMFSLQGAETSLTFGEDQTFSADSLAYLAELTLEDFFALRLIQNSDPDNVLWEWAYDVLFVNTVEEDEFNELDLDYYFLSADDTVLPLGASLLSYASKPEEERDPISLKWIVEEGDAELESVITDQSDGVLFLNTVTMPNTVGSSAKITVHLLDDSEARTSFKEIVVIPGRPASVSLSVNGSAGIQGSGEIEVVAQVRDQFGNEVNDGTPINFELRGQARFKESDYIVRNGIAKATIIGGFLPESNGQVLVVSGEANSQASFSISGVQLVAIDVPTNPTTNSLETISLQVLDASGGPQEGVYVDLSTTRGKLAYREHNIKSDSNGLITFDWHTGWSLGTTKFTARIGNQQLFSQELDISAEDGLPNDHVDVFPDDAMLIADVTTPGNVAYDNQIGSATIPDNFEYQTSELLDIEGSAGSSVNIKLGNDEFPNYLPQLKLEGENVENFGYKDDTEQHRIQNNRVTQIEDHPSSMGQAFSFKHDLTVPPETDPSFEKQHSKLAFNGTNLSQARTWLWKLSLKPKTVPVPDSTTGETQLLAGSLLKFGSSQELSIGVDG